MPESTVMTFKNIVGRYISYLFVVVVVERLVALLKRITRVSKS